MRREAVALIQDIPLAKDIVRRTVAEAERLLAGAPASGLRRRELPQPEQALPCQASIAGVKA